ncbi:short chain dehydrogenase/reductase family oxidoreductase [Alcanivorax hongdengensis A-11-3]|uniref:Short chain dehydrogenase/reductase family oxidoreductase n=1 Tax=Alcanivorax hongdengensis A-11-3 TaxID=1177179 RepID=L0WD17_9GAMM|nr:SDR family NAD(P)-dependent oxidoreductase [Alcanivorax hongdengensis]EKF74841.1 short chain dehydrogenase/reductase family oxidoreductase [Alcanivorax hongdengensis A-11-3]
MKQLPTLLILGGTTPLGQALAQQAGGRFRTAIADADAHLGNQICQQLHSEGHEALFMPVSQGRRGEIQQAMERILRRWQRLDVVINLAHTPVSGPFEAIDPGLWQTLLNEQLMATVYSCQSAVATMKRQRSGCLLNVISQQGVIPEPLRSANAVTGGAIAALSESLDAELAGLGIQVSLISIPLTRGSLPPLATDPLSRIRLEREIDNARLETRQLAQQILATIGRKPLHHLPDTAGHHWFQRRWFRGRWRQRMRRLGEKYRR